MPEKRVMVVDDLSVIRGFVKAALRDLKVMIMEASDGHHALEMQGSLPADVIVCDISMPGMGGEEFLTQLRERGDQTPVIMLTADGDKTVVARLVKLGIQGYLLKPFKPAVLSDRVKEALVGAIPPPPPPPADGDGDADTPADAAQAEVADEDQSEPAEPAAPEATDASTQAADVDADASPSPESTSEKDSQADAA